MAYAYPAPPVAVDPTNVTGRRIGAFFIDAAIAIVAFMVIFFPLATQRTVDETLRLPGCHRKFDEPRQIECSNRQVFRVGDTVYEADGGPTFGLDFLFTLFYFGVFQGLTGATVGKYLTGIRVVDAEGNIAGMGRSLLRWLVFAVDGPLSAFLCGLLTSLLSKGHRRLGDMAAGTYVVGRDAVGRPVVIPGPVVMTYPMMPPMAAMPPPVGGTPQWDPSRGAYVQWDPASGRYAVWDQATQTWH